MRENMIRQCCICGVVYGEKEPFEDKSVTHGLCKKCFKREMKKLEGTGRKKNPTFKPKIFNQGKVIVDVYPEECMIMFPTGKVISVPNKTLARNEIRRFFEKTLKDQDSMGIGYIEWRKR